LPREGGIEVREGRSSLSKISFPLWRGMKKESQREAKPLLKKNSPPLIKGKGIIGDRVNK